MAEEGKITMNEFKTVVESFRSEIKALKERATFKEQFAFLNEGQNAIRSNLRHKADYKEIEELWKRVTRLEIKAI